MFNIYRMWWSLLIVLLTVLQVALLPLIERKYLSLLQRRIGPTFVGYKGKYQFIADALKLVFKEITQPQRVNKFIFKIVTGFCFWCAWFVNTIAIYGPHLAWCDIDYHLFYVLIFSTLGGFSVMVAGLISRSKYAILGCIRMGVQIISYEIFFNIICLHSIVLASSLNFMEIVSYQTNIWFIYAIAPIAVTAFLIVLLECSRAPFDLPEAEAELVAGYNVEYGGILFALFYLAEYFHVWLAGGLYNILFCGGFNFFFFNKLLSIVMSLTVFGFFFIKSFIIFICYTPIFINNNFLIYY